MEDMKGLEKQIDTLFVLNEEITNTNNNLKIENAQYKKLYEELCIHLKDFEKINYNKSFTDALLKFGCFCCGLGIGFIANYLLNKL